MIKIYFENHNKKNKKEFSKKIVDIVAASAILGTIGTVLAVLFLGLPEALACTLIGALGSIVLTCIVFYYKKAQAENTIKLYLSSYAEIIKMKKNSGEDSSELLHSIEDNMINKMDNTLNQTLDEATAPIEKEVISG